MSSSFATPRPAVIGVLLVLCGSTIFQFGSTAAAQLFPHIGPLATAFLRQFIAAVLLLAITRPKVWEWNRTQWQWVLLFGLVLAAMNSLFYCAIDRIPLAVAVTIEFLGPLGLAAGLSRTIKDIFWVILALAGIGLFGIESWTTSANLDPLGLGFITLAACCWALYIVVAGKVGEQVPGTAGLAVALFIASLCIAPLGAPRALPVLFDAHLFLLALLTALMASLIPFTLEFVALRMIPNATFSILMSLEPAIAAGAGWVVLNQPISSYSVVAIGCVILASVGSTWFSRKKATVVAEGEF